MENNSEKLTLTQCNKPFGVRFPAVVAARPAGWPMRDAAEDRNVLVHGAYTAQWALEAGGVPGPLP